MIDRVITSGTFSLDGGTWEVDNNVWLVGDARSVIVIDAAHSAEKIAERVGGRSVTAIVCTHAHNDHINAAAPLAELTGAPILLHPADQVLWEMHYGDAVPYTPLEDGASLKIGGIELRVIHTPGHAPGAVCLHAPELGVVFTGDTLFSGGPRRDGQVVLLQGDAAGVDQNAAAVAARRDRRPHRTRRLHHHRRGEFPLGHTEEPDARE
ncbi:glyoxylase-like metal-dependent hydrolase (beta-lactamase superfamily II) [Nonomuraea dietziae]|uniref:Glyoxylase-like metal-dependent hydrolase (Beta-lactamase superfamily II) n=1 Tax=Nonomuraea dietziae TaxID=65515 RepID=A0A7W5Y8E2_9ACTN|nr:glyoxylase-like metal-dependent hydrolase (beta-lactamase superfamily II) [Nonomuraea dietziae]